MKRPNFFLYLFFLLVPVSCSLDKVGKDVNKSVNSYLHPKPSNLDRVFGKDVPQKQPAKQPPPPAVTDALVPGFNQSLASSGSRGLISVSVHDVDAREFFMGLVADTDENMLVHPDVKGSISLELKNVTVPQVLEAVQKVYGYDYKKSDIGYMIYPATLQTRTFKVDYLDLKREGKSRTQVSSGQITPQGGSTSKNQSQSGGTQQSSNTASNTSSSSQNQNRSNSSGSSLETTTTADFWKELDNSIKSILSVDKQATAKINPQAGTIVVRANPNQLREIENFLTVTQNQISRQVILEAKILEIILDDAHQAGVNWESIVKEGVNKLPLLTGVGALGALNPAVFTVGTSLRAAGGDFRAFVELLESQGKTNILSNPRVSTLNNQTAIIKVGRDEFFITDISTTTSASAGNLSISSSPTVTFTPFFSGIALDVTPQIDDDDSITLHIHPSITRVEGQNKKFSFNGSASEVPLALNTVRESDSIVKIEDGQIIVLGGLIQESDTESKEGVAGLTEIPILGNLFRVNTGKIQKSELIILLKATLIGANSDWKNDLGGSQRRMESLDSKPRWR